MKAKEWKQTALKYHSDDLFLSSSLKDHKRKSLKTNTPLSFSIDPDLLLQFFKRTNPSFSG